MSMTIDDIDDFDEDLYTDGEDNSYDEYETDSEYEYEEDSSYSDDLLEDDDDNEVSEGDVISHLLRSKGINPDSVKFETVDGDLEEVAFDDLSIEDQLQLLQYNELDDNYGLTQEEVALINQLRYNNLSVQDYNNYIAKQAVDSFQNYTNQQQPRMQVDDISDDELFIIDLQARIPDITDDELVEELESAKMNENVYARKIESIRNEYRERELMMAEQEQQEAAYQAQQQMAQFEQVIVDSIQKNDTIDLGDSSLSLSVDDKNEIASFILDSDPAGVRYISKALQDPNTLVKMAWYALKGDETIRQISDYYKKQISEVSKYNYNKGYEDARSGKAANTSKSIVRKSSRKQNRPLTIDDID